MQAISAHSPLIKRTRQEAVFLAASMVDRSVDAARVSLEAAERSAASTLQRQQLSDALAALNKQRVLLRTGYAARVDDAIVGALNTASMETAAPGRATDSELALLDDAEVVRFVEASRLQQTAMPVVEHSLARLDSLMSSALGLPVVRSDLNPLRPEVLCGALLQLLDSLPESAETRSHWVRHLAPPFAQELNRLYQTICKLLEEQGIEEARYRLKLTDPGTQPTPLGAASASGKRGGPGAAGPGGGAGQSNDAMPSDAELARQKRALFPSMEELAGASPAVSHALIRDFLYRPQWVADNDEPLSPAYYEAVQEQAARVSRAPVVAYDEQAYARQRARDRALSVVDRPGRDVDIDAALPPAQWGELASPAVRTQALMALKGQARKISQALGLDAVRTLVAQVAGDRRVMAPVREAFVAIEPALLRMAMADPRFLGDDNHPARRLIEGVAQRSFKYNDEYAEEFEQFMQPVREVVRELNAEADPRPSDFSKRLGELESRWRAEDSGEAEVQEVGLRSMRFAQERQALADKIAWEFSLRSDMDRVPAVVADFLFKDWSLVIAHAQLTDTGGGLDPGGYLAVVTDLIWSVKREAVLKEPARLFKVIPGVIQTLRRGLDMLGKDPAETEQFFEALMRYHDPVLRLRRLRSARDAEASGHARLEGESDFMPIETEPIPMERPSPKAAEQPWLGKHELAAAGFDEEADTGHASLQAPLSAQGADSAHGEFLHTDFGTTFSAAAPLDAPAPADTVRGALPQAADGAFPPLDEPAAAPLPPARSTVARPPAETPEQQEARTKAILERLRKGDWVDLRVRGQWRRAQLSWTSDNGALYMFVSRGGRPHSMTRRTCEKLVRERRLRPVDVGPVVDKALRKLSENALRERESVAA